MTQRSDPENGRFTLGTLINPGTEKIVDSAPGHVARVQQLVFEPLTAAQQRALRTPLATAANELRSLLRDRLVVMSHGRAPRGRRAAEPIPHLVLNADDDADNRDVVRSSLSLWTGGRIAVVCQTWLDLNERGVIH